MKKNTKNGKVNDKMVLVILAVVIIAVLVVLVMTNLNKGDKTPGNDVRDDQNAVDNQNTPNDPDNPTAVVGGVENNSEGFKQPHRYGVYTFSNIKVETSAEKSRITADVSADASQSLEAKMVEFALYDTEGNLAINMGVYVPQIEPGETGKIDASIDMDLSNIVDFEVREYGVNQ